MKTSYKILLAGFAMSALLASCFNDKQSELYPAPVTGGCDTTNITYNGKISQIINTNCNMSTCHDAGSRSAGFDLSNYAAVQNAASNPRFFAAINHTGPYPMPKGRPKLSDCAISQLTLWVAKGTPQ